MNGRLCKDILSTRNPVNWFTGVFACLEKSAINALNQTCPAITMVRNRCFKYFKSYKNHSMFLKKYGGIKHNELGTTDCFETKATPL